MSDTNIHRFTQAVIPLFENCEFCGERILCTLSELCIIRLAPLNPAYQCSQCLKFCHKQCCETADSIFPCSGKPGNRGNQELLFQAFPVNHTLAENTVRFYEDIIRSNLFSFGRDDPANASQFSSSFRSHHSVESEDLDTDSEDNDVALPPTSAFSGSPRELEYSPGQGHLLLDKRSANGDSSAPSVPTYNLPILKKRGFLTVIIQQASDLDVSLVGLK